MEGAAVGSTGCAVTPISTEGLKNLKTSGSAAWGKARQRYMGPFQRKYTGGQIIVDGALESVDATEAVLVGRRRGVACPTLDCVCSWSSVGWEEDGMVSGPLDRPGVRPIGDFRTG